MKLGKRTPRHDPRTLRLADYLRAEALPIIPDTYDWSGKVPAWQMLDNDRLSCCTISGAGHQIMSWTANASTEFIPSDSDIITAYSAVSGYDPNTGENDNGAVEIDVLNYWRQTGIAGHTIDSYVALEPGNYSHVQAAVYLFGGCCIGLALPLSARSQKVWSVPIWGKLGNGAPNSWGGHAVNCVAWDQHYITIVTWGALKKMTWAFWQNYCDEAYAVLSQDFVNKQQVAPNALDWASLQQDLQQVTA
jgi:hypothetical protein